VTAAGANSQAKRASPAIIAQFKAFQEASSYGSSAPRKLPAPSSQPPLEVNILPLPARANEHLVCIGIATSASSMSLRLTTGDYSIHLNEQLAQITVMCPLCAFIATNAAELSACNVANSFRKLFQLSSTPADKERWQQAVGILEEAATRLMQKFQPQQIANILHITTKNGYQTCLLPELERRAEATGGDFNSQNVANTLWTYATMGRKPGERLMGLLERWAEVTAGEFQVAGVAQMLVWFRFSGRPWLAFLRVPTSTNPEFTSTGKRKHAEVDT
jgi:hypothetical protein